MQAEWHRSNTWTVQKAQIRPQWTCVRRCQGPAGQMSLSGTVRESLCSLTGQLHDWMSPSEEGDERRRRRRKQHETGERKEWGQEEEENVNEIRVDE